MDPEFDRGWPLIHPLLPSHDEGWLDVGDGHSIHWEVAGNPLGRPALFVHGGPGAGCTAQDRRWFDPARWRVVLFDQRGAGRSRAEAPLHANTTPHLVADIEALRKHLGIGHWLLFGGSWGATLALAYAERHPHRVQALVLRGVFTARACETRWLYGPQGAALVHPAAWQRLRNGAHAEPGDELLQALHDRLHGSDSTARSAAARAWCCWEQDLMDAETTQPAKPSTPCEEDHTLQIAKIGVHYARHGFFLTGNPLIEEATALREVPGVIVQGQRDLVTPPATAQALHRAWPRAQLHLVPAAGHASSHPGTTRELLAAVDLLAARPTQKSTGDCNDREKRVQP